MSNVPCHGLICFRPASKLCLRGWICIQAFSKSCFLWLMLWSDHVRILNRVSKQGGNPTFFCYDITGFGYEKPAPLQGYSCAISVACRIQSRALSYCSALHHSLSQNSQICIQAIQWSYFYSQRAGSAPHFSECESPPEAHLWSGQQAPSYALHQGGWKLSLYWSSDLNTLTSDADPKKPSGCIPSVNDGEISPKGKITFRYCGVWWSTGLFQ